MKKYLNFNDSYVLLVTENYIVINDNDTGVFILDKEFNYIKTITISDELSVYQSFSCDKNDYILLQDVYAKKLYLVNIEESSCKEFTTEKVFYNYIHINGSSFTLLEADKLLVTYSYVNFPRVETTNPMNYLMEGLLCNYEDQFLCCRANELLTYNQQILSSPPKAAYGSPNEVFDYKVYDKDIMCYSEKKVYIYTNFEWIDFFEVPEEQTIIKCAIDNNRIYVLAGYNRGDMMESALYYKSKMVK